MNLSNWLLGMYASCNRLSVSEVISLWLNQRRRPHCYFTTSIITVGIFAFIWCYLPFDLLLFYVLFCLQFFSHLPFVLFLFWTFLFVYFILFFYSIKSLSSILVSDLSWVTVILINVLLCCHRAVVFFFLSGFFGPFFLSGFSLSCQDFLSHLLVVSFCQDFILLLLVVSFCQTTWFFC